MRNEVTVKEFREFVRKTNYITVNESLNERTEGGPKGDRRPTWQTSGADGTAAVVHLHLQDMEAYAKWVTDMERECIGKPVQAVGQGPQRSHANSIFLSLGEYRLPFEDEFEYCCFKHDPACAQVENAFGLLNLQGGVCELTAGPFDANLYPSLFKGEEDSSGRVKFPRKLASEQMPKCDRGHPEPTKPVSAKLDLVARGGSDEDALFRRRATYRFRIPYGREASGRIGFRLVRTIESSQ